MRFSTSSVGNTDTETQGDKQRLATRYRMSANDGVLNIGRKGFQCFGMFIPVSQIRRMQPVVQPLVKLVDGLEAFNPLLGLLGQGLVSPVQTGPLGIPTRFRNSKRIKQGTQAGPFQGGEI